MSSAIVPSRLRHLGRRAEEPQLVRQLREELREKVRMVESTMLNLDNLVSPLDWLDAGDGFPGLGPWRMNRPVDRTMDRTHAPINYLNEQEWRLQFSMVRDLCVRNHLAIGFRDHVTNFVGPMKISFVLRGQSPGTSVSDPQNADATGATAVDPLVSRVQQFWDEWCEFAGWGEGADDREEECRRRLVVEGEATLRFFVGDGNSSGLPYARHIEPECIRTPPGHSTMDDWGWGLLARSDDENIEALWECHPDNVNDGTAVPISEWVRIKGNGDRTTRRGLSDFFPMGELLRKIGGLHGNMAHVARLQAAIAWWEKYPTATMQQLANMVTLGQDYSRSKIPPNQGGAGTSVNSYEAGTVVRTEQRDVLPGPVSQPNGFGQVEQMVMRGIGFRWGFPSFFSGDGADSFASVLVTGSPFVRMTEERQKKVKGFCCQVAKRVMEFGERSGRLPRGTSQRVRPVATAKPVVIADEEKKSRTFAAEFAIGVADPFEYMRSKGLDPKAVMANQAAFRKQMAAMGAVAPAPPTGGGGATQPPVAPKGPTPAPPGSAGGDGSDSATTDPTKDIFKASEGKDANGAEHDDAGRFGSGGTGKKSSGAERDKLRDADDAALDAKEKSLIVAKKKELARDRKKADAATGRTRDKEDAKRERERDKELEKIDSAEERDPRTAANQKAEQEMFDRQTAEEQDLVTRYESEAAATRAALEQRQARGEISAGDVQGELGALSARHHRELKHLRLKHEAEENEFAEATDLGYDAKRDAAQERWDAEDDAIGDRRAAEDAALEDAREKEDDALDSETHPDIAAERAALQSRRDAEDEADDDTAPVPVADLARNSGADNAHLDALAAAETDPQTKDYLETAAFNLPGPDDDAIAHVDGIYDKTFPTDHEARRFATVAQLKMQQRAATKAGHTAAADRLGRVIKGFGPTRGIESIFGPRVAAATDLARRALVRWLTERRFTGIDSNGHHWRDGKQVKANQSASGDTRGASAKAPTSQPSASEPELSDEDKREIAAGIDDDVAALPEDRRPDAVTVAKAKELALVAVTKAYFWAERVQATRAFGLVTRALDAYLDNPTDLLTKIGYNPNNSSGTAGPQVADAVRDATGVSGHLVAKVAAIVLTKAVFAVKKRLAGAPAGGATEADESDAAFGAWAEFVTQLLAHLTEQLGASAPVPDAATVETALRSLVANR